MGRDQLHLLITSCICIYVLSNSNRIADHGYLRSTVILLTGSTDWTVPSYTVPFSKVILTILQFCLITNPHSATHHCQNSTMCPVRAAGCCRRNQTQSIREPSLSRLSPSRLCVEQKKRCEQRRRYAVLFLYSPR